MRSGYLASIFDFPACPFLCTRGCPKACGNPPAFAYRTQAGEAGRAHHSSWRSMGFRPFLLFSEPISDFSHNSAVEESELNKSLLGGVSFLQTPVQVFLGTMSGAKRVGRTSDSSCFQLITILYWLWAKIHLLLFFMALLLFFSTERQHKEVLFLLLSLN